MQLLQAMQNRGVLLQFFNETALIKAPSVVAYIDDLLESDKKFLVFAHHQSMMNCIQSLLVKKVNRRRK